MIAETTLTAIRQLDLPTAIEKYFPTTLKKKGKRFVGKSPWNPGERTPSFSVNPSLGIWKDFSSGHGGRGIISFVMDFYSLTFPEAVEDIASSFGIEVEYTDLKERGTDFSRVFDQYIKYFQSMLLKNQDILKENLVDRGIRISSIAGFKIGYCPPSPPLLPGVTRREFADSEISKMSGRIVFPIMGKTGRIVALTGRVVGHARGVGKYVNSSDSVWAKDTHWYGIESCTFPGDRAIIVEGQTDVIALHQAGVPAAVAKSTSTISDRQAEILSRYARSAILMPDNDRPGQQSVMRDAGKLMKYGIYVRVCMPEGEGMDPGKWFRDKSQLSHTEELYDYLFRVYELLPDEQKTLFIEKMDKEIFSRANPVLGKILKDKFSTLIGLPYQLIWASTSSKGTPEPGQGQKLDTMDVRFQALSLVINFPEVLSTISGVLEAPFNDPVYQEVWEHLLHNKQLSCEGEEVYLAAAAYDIKKEFSTEVFAAAVCLLHRAEAKRLSENLGNSQDLEKTLLKIQALSL